MSIGNFKYKWGDFGDLIKDPLLSPKFKVMFLTVGSANMYLVNTLNRYCEE